MQALRLDRATEVELLPLDQHFRGMRRPERWMEKLERRVLFAAGVGEVESTGDGSNAAIVMDGQLDTSFDGDGIAVIDVFDADRARSVIVQSDGKIVIAGWSGFAGHSSIMPSHVTLVRLNADGTLDQAFGDAGSTRIAAVGMGYYPNLPLAQQADGKLLVGGDALRRFNLDGSLDTTFGDNGTVVSGHDVRTIAVAGDGSIVTADATFHFRRYRATGALDTTFGAGGVTDMRPTDMPGIATLGDMVMSEDGKVIAIGSLYNSYKPGTQRLDFHQLLVRLNADGTPDAAFGDGGFVIPQTPLDDYQEGWTLALQRDGKIVTSGGTHQGVFVARFNVDGTFDDSFGDGGMAVHESYGIYAYDMTVDADGRILLAGTGYGSAVSRLNPDGSRDLTFGDNGLKWINILRIPGGSEGAYGIALQPDGQIVLAAQVDLENGGPNLDQATQRADFFIIRLHGSAGPAFPINVALPPGEEPVVEPTEPAGSTIFAMPRPITLFSSDHVSGAFDLDDPAGTIDELLVEQVDDLAA